VYADSQTVLSVAEVEARDEAFVKVSHGRFHDNNILGFFGEDDWLYAN